MQYQLYETWQELIRKMNDDYYLSIVFRNKQEKRQPRSCQAKTTAYWREYDGIAAILVTVTTDSKPCTGMTLCLCQQRASTRLNQPGQTTFEELLPGTLTWYTVHTVWLMVGVSEVMSQLTLNP